MNPTPKNRHAQASADWSPKIGETVVSKTWGMGSGDIGIITSFRNKAKDPNVCVVFWTGKRSDGTFGNLKGGCTCLISNLIPYGGSSQVVVKNPAAVALGRLGGKAGRGQAKARSSEQARAAVNARWAKQPRFKLVLVNDESDERQDSILKGAGMLSKFEANKIVKTKSPAYGWHYEIEPVVKPTENKTTL